MIFEPAVALTVGARLGRRMGVSEGLGPAAGVATAVVMAVAIFLGKSSLSMALECLRNQFTLRKSNMASWEIPWIFVGNHPTKWGIFMDFPLLCLNAGG